MERRLDNVVYRLGFAMTRREARQLVTHGHFTVNGQRVDIPSYLVKVGDVIEVREKSRSSVKFKRLLGEDAIQVNVPKWLDHDEEHPPRAKSLLCPPGTTSTSPWKSTSSSSCTPSNSLRTPSDIGELNETVHCKPSRKGGYTAYGRNRKAPHRMY